ncbi:BQ5605_C023g09760 [Microbotryum silenes-dioicae]|uniref:BQ5605_C023g09760 protein n=1 Tax=Microbotryum silenes-dioicae TaxID=796604 RepID=A0A2X0MPQ1_9BASI|nr:BQ5605_C023g09760 [Microbotryum silenes-dioicae]
MPATTSDPSKPLWSLPIRDRPPHGSLLRGLIWASLFNLGILLTHVLQLLLSPLLWHPRTRSTFHRWTKAPFGRLCVWINQAFAPTSFVISRGADEVGGDGVEDIEQWITRDSRV